MAYYETTAGQHISGAAEGMCNFAHEHNETVTANFNDIELVANPGDSPDAIVAYYNAESTRRHDEYVASPEYKQRQKEAADRQELEDAARREALKTAPDHMALRDAEGWQKTKDANTDGYGGAVITYAERWACLMEARLAIGKTVAECAKEASHLADVEGITGFMYGCAVGILSNVWIHGEQLRRWHNLDTQIGTEGERANESGGVLNPAILNIG